MMQSEGIDIDAGAATPLLGPLVSPLTRQSHSGCRLGSDAATEATRAALLSPSSSWNAILPSLGDQFAVAHPALAAASDLNATIADDELYALLGGDGDNNDDDGLACGAGPGSRSGW